MLKIECNSRENIIDFIEHSDKQLLVKAHYQSLVSDVLFEKALKVIAGLKKRIWHRVCCGMNQTHRCLLWKLLISL